MATTRIRHILGLLGTIAIPILTVWGDAGNSLASLSNYADIPAAWGGPA